MISSSTKRKTVPPADEGDAENKENSNKKLRAALDGELVYEEVIAVVRGLKSIGSVPPRLKRRVKAAIPLVESGLPAGFEITDTKAPERLALQVLFDEERVSAKPRKGSRRLYTDLELRQAVLEVVTGLRTAAHAQQTYGVPPRMIYNYRRRIVNTFGFTEMSDLEQTALCRTEHFPVLEQFIFSGMEITKSGPPPHIHMQESIAFVLVDIRNVW